jgi:ligand-binding sensor domain-containing protein
VRLEDTPDGWQITEVLTGKELAGPKVRSVFEDGFGQLWFGHEYDGITLRRGSRTVAMIGVEDGLPDPEVTVIRPDGVGGLWIGTLKGAVHLSAVAAARLFQESSGENDDA